MLMFAFLKTRPTAAMTGAWLHLHTQHASVLPNILPLAFASFSVAVQTAVVERGFSQHGIIKDALSNSLHLVTVDSLMRLRMHCSSTFADADMSLINDATEVLLETGLRSGQRPSCMLSKLYQAACDICIPADFVEAFKDQDPEQLSADLNSTCDGDPEF